MRVAAGAGREMMPSADKAGITPELVSRLVAAQFPRWAGLPGRLVEPELADFLAALYRIDPSGGPPPGAHNFLRGGVAEVWRAALAAPWPGPPVWVHGDVSPGNLLAVRGRLSAVIDFRLLGGGRSGLRHRRRVDVLPR